MKIYFDNAATTPVDERVLTAMLPYFKEKFGNPSSLHSFGQEASRGVSEAREIVAKFLGCEFEEVIFTSGSTESNNTIIKGLVAQFVKDHPGELPHIITSSIEHPATLEVCDELNKQGKIELDHIKPDRNGVVQVEDVLKRIKENTLLISLMYANNEIGMIQPIAELGERLEMVNASREQRIIFHTDATQAGVYLNMNMSDLKVDVLSFSGHKIYGPKGVAVLAVKQDIKFTRLLEGGHQEFAKRSGTLNVPLIVGFGRAVELIPERDNDKVRNLRDYLWSEIQDKVDDIRLNGTIENRLPNNLNISIKKTEGEALLLGLDMEGIAVSTGSACSAGSLEASHVLMAMDLSHEESHGSLRISLGDENTRAEVDYFLEKFIPLVEKIRQMAPDFD